MTDLKIDVDIHDGDNKECIECWSGYRKSARIVVVWFMHHLEMRILMATTGLPKNALGVGRITN